MGWVKGSDRNFETPEGTAARTEEEAHKGAAAAGGQKAGKEWGPQEP